MEGMVKMKDITGLKFGRLTVIEPLERRNSNGAIMWKCKCDCGNETSVATHPLIIEEVKSCGCYLTEIRQLRNKKIGWLEIVNKLPIDHKDGSFLYHCKCVCGKELDLSRKQLRCGWFRSCGCKDSNLIGIKKGMLKVLSQQKNVSFFKDLSWIVECQCDCGKIVKINSPQFNRTKTISCGCTSYETYLQTNKEN
jgi:hypothetical protein